MATRDPRRLPRLRCRYADPARPGRRREGGGGTGCASLWHISLLSLLILINLNRLLLFSFRSFCPSLPLLLLPPYVTLSISFPLPLPSQSLCPSFIASPFPLIYSLPLPPSLPLHLFPFSSTLSLSSLSLPHLSPFSCLLLVKSKK